MPARSPSGGWLKTAGQKAISHRLNLRQYAILTKDMFVNVDLQIQTAHEVMMWASLGCDYLPFFLLEYTWTGKFGRDHYAELLYL